MRTPSTQTRQPEVPTDVPKRSRNQPPQKTTEAISCEKNHPGKTELCGRPAVSQIEVQPSNTEVLQSRVRFNPQRKTAQYYQIFTPTHATSYCYSATQEGNKFRKLPKYDISTATDANCSTSIAIEGFVLRLPLRNT